MLRTPGEVAAVETESTGLDVATAHTHVVNALRADTGVGGLTTELELPLLAVVGVASTSG